MSKEITPFTIEVGSARIKGEQAGSGKPVIFSHAGVADRRMWRKQIDALSDSYRCISWDTRGAGETTCIDEPFRYMDDLRAVLDELNIEKATLVGCSNGGGIAVDFALAWPDRVEALVLIAPGISGAPFPETLPDELQVIFNALKEAEEAGDRKRVNEIEAHIWLDGPTSPEGRMSDAALRDLFLDMNAIQLREYPKLTQREKPEPAYPRLVELTMPTMVLIGDRDFDDLQALCAHIAATLPDVQLHEIADAAHLPGLEKPKVVNELLRTFLDDAPSGGIDAG